MKPIYRIGLIGIVLSTMRILGKLSDQSYKQAQCGWNYGNGSICFCGCQGTEATEIEQEEHDRLMTSGANEEWNSLNP